MASAREVFPAFPWAMMAMFRNRFTSYFFIKTPYFYWNFKIIYIKIKIKLNPREAKGWKKRPKGFSFFKMTEGAGLIKALFSHPAGDRG